MKKSKKIIILISIFTLLIIAIITFILLFNNKTKSTKTNNELKPLPLPEVTGGTRGELGIDKNINEQTIDDYLGREDSVYRDMRMLEDPASYENIGGDRFLSGFIKGFEVIPLPYIIPVTGLPDEVGNTYVGTTLFSYNNNEYTANYEESLKIIEEVFPKDKYIFLMCGGGGYAGMTKNFLVSLGWDEKKIYNIGGYWYYNGKNNISIKKVEGNNITYDFDKVKYHIIEFEKLTKIDKRIEVSSLYYSEEFDEIDVQNGTWPGHTYCMFLGNYSENETCKNEFKYTRTNEELENDIQKATEMKAATVNDSLNNKKTFIVLVDGVEVCTGRTADSVDLYWNAFQYFRDKNIKVYKMGSKVYKETNLYKDVKYFPTIIIVKDGIISDYTDPNKDEHIELYRNYDEVVKWINERIKIDD